MLAGFEISKHNQICDHKCHEAVDFTWSAMLHLVCHTPQSFYSQNGSFSYQYHAIHKHYSFSLLPLKARQLHMGTLY